MKWIVISLALGIITAVGAYFVLGMFGKSKPSSSEKLKTGPVIKKSEDSEEESITPVQQSLDHPERLIPTREWTGGKP
jgi:hypothetical protein